MAGVCLLIQDGMDYSNQGCILSSLRVKRSFELIFKHILRKFRQSEEKVDTNMRTQIWEASVIHLKLINSRVVLITFSHGQVLQIIEEHVFIEEEQMSVESFTADQHVVEHTAQLPHSGGAALIYRLLVCLWRFVGNCSCKQKSSK